MNKLTYTLAVLLCIVTIIIAIAAWPTFTIMAKVTVYLFFVVLFIVTCVLCTRVVVTNYVHIDGLFVDRYIKREDGRQASETTTGMILDNQIKQVGLDHVDQVIKTNSGLEGVYLTKLLGMAWSSMPKGVTNMLPAYHEEPRRPLLDAIGHLPRIVVVGGMGSGKTNTILHLAKHKTETSEVRVFDSHSSPKKWPDGTNVSVIGTGRDYNAIAQDFAHLLGMMDERYVEIGDGKVEESGHPPITLVADEWTLLPALVPNMQESARSLFTEGRKASIGFVIAVHDLTVGALGLKGFSNLRESFDCIVFCRHDAKTREYITEVQWGWSEKERERMVPPGRYKPTILDAPVVDEFDDDPVIIDLSQPETKYLPSIPSGHSTILDAYSRMVNSEETFSWNKLAIQLYGKRGGSYNEKIRQILDQYGIDYNKYL